MSLEEDRLVFPRMTRPPPEPPGKRVRTTACMPGACPASTLSREAEGTSCNDSVLMDVTAPDTSRLETVLYQTTAPSFTTSLRSSSAKSSQARLITLLSGVGLPRL